MQIEQQILSDFIVHTKYSRFLPEQKRRETWTELVDRNKQMHLDKFKDKAVQDIIEEAYKHVYERKVLPSMRSMQFAGKAIEITPSRIYNCFSRDTSFITKEGVKSFEDYNKNDEIKVLSKDGTWNKAKVKSYGTQPLYYLTFKRGQTVKTIKATRNHRWLLKDGTETTNIQKSNQLDKTKDILSDFNYDEASPIEKLYWCYGFVYGDGVVNNGYSMLRLCGSDQKFEKRFTDIGFKSSSSASLKGDIIVYTGKYQKNTPDPKQDSPELIRAFVLGYLQADGEKNNDKRASNDWKSIQTSDKDHWEFIEKCFPIAGIYINTKFDLTGEETNYDVRPETYKYSLYHKISNSNSGKWSLTNIEPYGIEDVWCLEVENTKNFVLENGIPTGNCAYLPIDSIEAFPEIMFLLLGGTGVGYSIQRHDVRKLPPIKKPQKTRRYLIGDSIEGWADAVKTLIRAYFDPVKRTMPEFDYSDIRPKGARLVTSGGKAPGPEPLKNCLQKIELLLDRKEIGDQLRPIEVHDIVCHIADAVLAGGIRRAALISLFSMDDEEMIKAKSGAWWELNSQRGRANNSAVIVRSRVDKRDFLKLWDFIESSGSGEPGVYFTNDKSLGTNPCCEISLKPFQFCNLCEINAATVTSQEDFEERIWAATVIGTLQAAYTNFHYLRDEWVETTEKDALLGVGITGIASNKLNNINLKKGAEYAKEVNARMAKLLGINKASRVTTVKPSGTSSLVLGCSSGVHAYHDNYYIRGIQLNKNEAIYDYLVNNHPELIEDYKAITNTGFFRVPLKAPDSAQIRTEDTKELLDRIKRYNVEWVRNGHRDGINSNNVSATIPIKDGEWEMVGNWMWNNRHTFNGLSVLPFDGGSYTQAPFTSCTKKEYEEIKSKLTEIDLTNVIEEKDETDRQGEIACSSGSCEVV